jgi:hypothetical protein
MCTAIGFTRNTTVTKANHPVANPTSTDISPVDANTEAEQSIQHPRFPAKISASISQCNLYEEIV